MNRLSTCRNSAAANLAPVIVRVIIRAPRRSPRRHRLLDIAGCLALIIASAAAPAGSLDDPAARARIIATLPDWTGLWETDAAAGLLVGRPPATPKLWDKPPYTAEAQKRYAPDGFPFAGAANLFAVVNTRPGENCRPLGFPGAMEMPVPDFLFELLVTPEQALLLANDGTVRHIYTDGRAHPQPQDVWPTASGDSIGHWQGPTLVIDTVDREPGPIVDLPGVANLSDRAHFTEQLRLLDSDTLEDRMTIEDPLRFTQPLQVTIHYLRVKDMDRMIAIDCEHDRNTVGDKLGIAPPQ